MTGGGPLQQAVEEVAQALAGGGDPDDALRAVVAILHERGGYSWVGIRFVEESGAVLGPAAGDVSAAGGATAFPVSFQGAHVADLEVTGELGEVDRSSLERVAQLVSPYALVGWDTGGEAWEP